MGKMTKAQARKRLNEAARKLRMVYLNNHDLPRAQYTKLIKMADDLDYNIAPKLK